MLSNSNLPVSSGRKHIVIFLTKTMHDILGEHANFLVFFSSAMKLYQIEADFFLLLQMHKEFVVSFPNSET
ncbi:MAG: hypothetical protein CSA50_02240 [Gammaproteobacteria bacterium]|nr:MAG: hypothetical protein CSA50_02240 [Gammaproteobacteria bacterium]